MLVISKKRVAWLSVASNTILTAGKLAAGFLTGSVSILSEAAHSAIDLIAAGIATFSVHVSDRPADRDHPYGHEKVENISGVIEGVLIFGAAAWIIYESVDKLIHGVHLQFLGSGIVVMAVSAVLNIVVATLLRRTAIQERSVALEADAAHLYTDVYTSAGVMVGLAIITVGSRLFSLELSWLDPVIAMGVATLILSTAYRITRKSFLPLMDVAASRDELKCINEQMDLFRRRGVDFHKLRTRRAGGSLHVDLHMGCRPGVTLEHGHQVSHELKAKIEECLPGSKVLIHVEPSARIEVLASGEEQVRCMREELLKDERVCDVSGLRATSYDGDLRVEADLCLDPSVTLAEARVVSDSLRDRLIGCFPPVNEVVLSFHPGDGWQEAIHEDDKALINRVVGEHQGRLAGIHELKVSSSGGRHQVLLRLGVPPSLPVSDAHAIASHLEGDIRAVFPEAVEVDLHIEPCHEQCASCEAACPERAR